MKNVSKYTIMAIIKITVCLSAVPLLFVKLFHEVGYLVAEDGGAPLRVDYYHSMAENLSELNISIVSPIVVFCVSAVLSVLSLLRKNKITKRASRVSFAVSVLMLIAVFITAASVYRCY